MLYGIVWWEVLARLLLAIVAGGIFGLERQLHGRPAGLRTHILVCLGSALVMIISMYAFLDSNGNYVGDPSRLAAGVVGGIGFLGAGAIMHQGGDIKGITSAATLWIVGMIGLALGIGSYFAAGATTFLGISVIVILRFFEKKAGVIAQKVKVVVPSNQPSMKPLISICDRLNVKVSKMDAKVVEHEGKEAIEIAMEFLIGTSRNDVINFVNCVQKDINPLLVSME